MKYFVNNIFTMIYLFMHKSYFLKKIDIAGRIKEQIRKQNKGTYIRVEEMWRERCTEDMPGLLLALSIDVTSASLEVKKQESAIMITIALQQPSRIVLGIVWFFLFLDNRSIISSVQVPLGHLSLSVLLLCFVRLCVHSTK